MCSWPVTWTEGLTDMEDAPAPACKSKPDDDDDAAKSGFMI